MMTTVKQILEQKGSAFHAVRPTDSVFDALSLMAQFDIGCVLVTESDKLVGIFTERDYARKIALKGLHSSEALLADVMTARLYTVGPRQTVQECMSIMTKARIRHLPVVEAGEVIGLVSIGDLVNATLEEQRFHIAQLESYIAGNLG